MRPIHECDIFWYRARNVRVRYGVMIARCIVPGCIAIITQEHASRMATLAPLPAAIDEIIPGVIADRRYLHEHPELGFQEHETAAFVAQRLDALGCADIRTGIGGTGVTALIHGTAGGPAETRVIALRADMDALPIQEETGAAYASQTPGVMHACGHDAHTAILLGVARILMARRAEFAGTVKLLFQPAEEIPPGGAALMVAEGVLDDPQVEAVFGLHVNPGKPAGTLEIAAGPIFASADDFDVIIRGSGGHAAYPQQTVDPLIVGMEMIGALQTLVSRETDPMQPAILSVCTFHVGTAHNVIAESATFGGTVRTHDAVVRDQLERRIREVVDGIARAHGATAEINYQRGYPPMVNDPAWTALVRAAGVATVGEANVLPMLTEMGAEDFSVFLDARSGSYFYLGCGNEAKGITATFHHPRFDVDDEALGIGVEAMVRIVLLALAPGGARDLHS